MHVVTAPSASNSRIPSILPHCTQCGEKLVARQEGTALPIPRTGTQLCGDCDVYDLPHTD